MINEIIKEYAKIKATVEFSKEVFKKALAEEKKRLKTLESLPKITNWDRQSELAGTNKRQPKAEKIDELQKLANDQKAALDSAITHLKSWVKEEIKLSKENAKSKIKLVDSK